MKKLLPLFFIPMLSLGQSKKGVLKIDLDTTIIYTSIGIVFEYVDKDLPDSINALVWADTVICNDFTTLKYKNQTYDIDIHKALKKALKTNNCEIYFKSDKIANYSTERKRKIRKYDYYNYSDNKTSQVFLQLIIYQRHYCITKGAAF